MLEGYKKYCDQKKDMAKKWVGIYIPKLLYPLGEMHADLPNQMGINETKDSVAYREQAKAITLMIKHVSKKLAEHGVNTIVFDVDDLEVRDNEIRITSGVVEDKILFLKDGVVPSAVFNRYISWF